MNTIFYLSQMILQKSLFLLLIVGISFQILIATYFTYTFVPVAFGFETKEDFLSKIRPTWIDYRNVNKLLDENSKVLHLVGDRQYYLKHNQFYPSPYFQGFIDWTKIHDVKVYREKLKEAGFTHIIAKGDYGIGIDIINKEDDGIKNILKFQNLNGMLIKTYTKKLYSSNRVVPKSRTIPLGNKQVNFILYELL